MNILTSWKYFWIRPLLTISISDYAEGSVYRAISISINEIYKNLSFPDMASMFSQVSA